MNAKLALLILAICLLMELAIQPSLADPDPDPKSGGSKMGIHRSSGSRSSSYSRKKNSQPKTPDDQPLDSGNANQPAHQQSQSPAQPPYFYPTIHGGGTRNDEIQYTITFPPEYQRSQGPGQQSEFYSTIHGGEIRRDGVQYAITYAEGHQRLQGPGQQSQFYPSTKGGETLITYPGGHHRFQIPGQVPQLYPITQGRVIRKDAIRHTTSYPGSPG